MPAVDDPFYTRKPVPDTFIQDIGESGLTPQEEFLNRERKYSIGPGGGDVRKFSNPKLGKTGKKDPFYQRKQVPDSMISGVGETGLTEQEEYINRERKYSLADGSDARRFSSAKGGLTPASDPHYGRRQVSDAEIIGIGDTGGSKAEDFEVRERKQSMFQLSDDPFAQISGHHRPSIAGQGAVELAAAAHRRKSSAIAPDHMPSTTQHHSGYDGDHLAPIESRVEDGPGHEDDIRSSEAEGSTNGHTKPHHQPADAWEDPDAVGPHDIR
jgi:hypothetical protein